MSWFRRHRRYLMAGLVVLLMASWGMLGTLQRLVRRTEGAFGTVRGEAVSRLDMEEAAGTLRLAVALGFVDPRMLGFLRFPSGSPRAAAVAITLARELAEFAFEEGWKVDNESVWRFLVLLREVEGAGVEVTLEEARELLALSPILADETGPDPARYRTFLGNYGYTDGEAAQSLVRLVGMAKLIALHRGAVTTSRPELWMAYRYDKERRRIRFVEVDGTLFVPLVAVSRQDLEGFYAEHKDSLPDPAMGQIGYKAPERVRVEYAIAPVEEIQRGIRVEADEIAAYYEMNKYEFRREESDSQDEGEDQENEPEADRQSAEPRFEELDEVRDVIRDRLARQKAQQKADELAAKVLEDLDAARPGYANEPLPLGQMARRHGLVHRIARTADGRELLSRLELEVAVPQGVEVGAFAFEEAMNLYDPRLFDSGEASLICQVLERQSAQPAPFEEVEENVRRDYVKAAALERATAFGGKLRDSIVKLGFDAAAEQMSGRLANLLKSPELQPSLGPEEGAAILKVQESGFFGRQDGAIPGLIGPHPAVVERASGLDPDEVGVATEGPPVSRCYVIQVVERLDAPREGFVDSGPVFRRRHLAGKQSQAVREWMEGLLEAAVRTKRVESE